MDATASSIAEDAEEWLERRRHRFDPPETGPGADTAMDDASRETILALEDLAARWIAGSGDMVVLAGELLG